MNEKSPELMRFAALVEQRLGFRFEPVKAKELLAALAERVEATGSTSVEAYLQRVERSSSSAHETAALARRLSVGETYFFRESEHHEALVQQLSPELDKVGVSRGKLRILSVGCSSGEEPYGVAISLLEAGRTAREVELAAFDANPDAIERARRGEYAAWALRAMPAALRERYFIDVGRGRFRLIDQVRALVSFEVRNVLDDGLSAWVENSQDAIFCRNVLIYFSDATSAVMHQRLCRALRPGGVLFLGHSELLRDRRLALETRRVGGAFFHVKRVCSAGEAEGPSTTPITAWASVSESPSRKMAALISPDPPPSLPLPPEPCASSAAVSPAYEEALRLIRLDCHEDALELLAKEGMTRGEEALLRAAILTSRGAIDEAEVACIEALDVVENRASVHYLLGMCREHAGDHEEALRRYRMTLELDPFFAMAHLRIGMLARRSGALELAKTSLERALWLLPRQDTRTLTLFRSGQGLGALMQLCRAELAACQLPLRRSDGGSTTSIK